MKNKMKTKEEVKQRLEYWKGYRAALENGEAGYSLNEIEARIGACESVLEGYEKLAKIMGAEQ